MGEVLSNDCGLVIDDKKDVMEIELINPLHGGIDAPAV